MALFDNIINKYFKTPAPEEFSVDDIYVSTKDKAETTAESNATERLSGTINPYSQVGEGKGDAGNMRFSMPQTQPSYSPGVGAYEQLWAKLYDGVEGEPESQEDIEKREKREKRNSTISSLGDAIGGIANIWGATKGATPMDLSSLSEANKKRYDYAKERRERNQEAWRRGMFNARANDMNALAQSEQLRRKAEEKAAAQKYKEEQDKVRQEQWQTKYDFDAEQAERKASLEQQKFEEQKRKNQADEKIRLRTVALAERKATAELNNTSGTGIKKVVRFGMKDGTNIAVPDDLKGSYVADVYNQLVNAAGDATIDAQGNTANPILSFMKFQFGQKEPGLNEMMTAIQLYKDEYPGIEDYMIERANQYTENYQTPVAKDQSAPGAPGAAKVPIDMKGLAPNWGTQPINSKLPVATEDELLEYLIE